MWQWEHETPPHSSFIQENHHEAKSTSDSIRITLHPCTLVSTNKAKIPNVSTATLSISNVFPYMQIYAWDIGPWRESRKYEWKGSLGWNIHPETWVSVLIRYLVTVTCPSTLRSVLSSIQRVCSASSLRSGVGFGFLRQNHKDLRTHYEEVGE